MAANAALHEPLVQLNVADPVTGSPESTAVVLKPELVVEIVPEQALAPTDHDTAFPEQATGAGGVGTLHDVDDAVPQEPFVQVKVAEPVAGRSESTAVALDPELVVETDAEHEFAPTDQDTDLAEQAAGVGVVELWQW